MVLVFYIVKDIRDGNSRDCDVNRIRVEIINEKECGSACLALDNDSEEIQRVPSVILTNSLVAWSDALYLPVGPFLDIVTYSVGIFTQSTIKAPAV
jgi:hypothetical protein